MVNVQLNGVVGLAAFRKGFIMHILDISTNLYKDIHKDERNKHMVDVFFNDISRSIQSQTKCQIDYNGWHVGDRNRIHVEIIILSNDPSVIGKVCDIIEEQKNLPKWALTFLK